MESARAEPNPEVPPLGVLVLAVDGETVALPLDDVIEVLPAAAPEPLPTAPAVVTGLINLRGAPLPVLDLRTRLGLPRRDPDPDDHVVVCRVGARHIGLWVDRALRVDRLGRDSVAAIGDLAKASHVSGAILLTDGMLVVYDVHSFLDTEEALGLDEAMAQSLAGDRR